MVPSFPWLFDFNMVTVDFDGLPLVLRICESLLMFSRTGDGIFNIFGFNKTYGLKFRLLDTSVAPFCLKLPSIFTSRLSLRGRAGRPTSGLYSLIALSTVPLSS